MIKTKKGHKIIERIPPERILTETDGPYVKIKGRPAEPGDVILVMEYLKDVWNTSLEKVEKKIHQNFNMLIKRIFNKAK